MDDRSFFLKGLLIGILLVVAGAGILVRGWGEGGNMAQGGFLAAMGVILGVTSYYLNR